MPSSEAEGLIRRRLEEERARLREELGIADAEHAHHSRPAERPFTASQRPHTTLLFGGLTPRHEALIRGGAARLGYRPEPLPTPDAAAFQIGREYGNNGQCSPTYFTVGNLVQYLQRLQAEGRSREEIIDSHVFVTAGACGPCRFGMYESEYRLALRNAGFDGFRVLIFQQSGSFDQSGEADGLELNVDFFLMFLNALMMGDVLGDVAYQTRPFEVESGSTDAAMERAIAALDGALDDRDGAAPRGVRGSVMRRLGERGGTTEIAAKVAEQSLGERHVEAVREAGARLRSVSVDRTRVKPIVKITGEFWAQTTEGDGNYNMFAFLEREGAQVLVEPVTTWVMYLIHQAKLINRDRQGVGEEEAAPVPWRVDRRMAAEISTRRRNAKLSMGEAALTREWNRLRAALGGVPHELTDQYELQRIAHPLYNSRAAGGEGHLEVAKNVYYSNRGICHMVLSLKPFGCMPSTQSDGVQSAVINRYRDMIYLPIETSGEGEINAHSRVQMALGEAKVKAREEVDRVLEQTGLTLESVREYAEEHPELQDPLYPVPRAEGVIGTAANLVLHVHERMGAGRPARRAAVVAAGMPR